MELSNQQTLPVSQAIAWEALNDITMLQAAIPGCESITPSEPNQYEVVVMAAVGPVKAKFKGKLKLSDIVAPTSYVINFDGQGGAAGHGKGSATVSLAADGPDQTTLSYTAKAQVGGKIAQIGSRLVDMAAQKMANEFFNNFTQALQDKYGKPAEPAAAEPEPEAPPASAAARLLAWFKKLFGG
ncbi:MAG TPA: carbon monoxide dehydrogenase subunit G [Ideonella sp.]|nr:carbon monoxide dehydrogenase subunit G [Ideonella sp.]